MRAGWGAEGREEKGDGRSEQRPCEDIQEEGKGGIRERGEKRLFND